MYREAVKECAKKIRNAKRKMKRVLASKPRQKLLEIHKIYKIKNEEQDDNWAAKNQGR